jgi:hypothetical protein
MSIEPWINWQFHKTPGLIDPRAGFSRAGIGRTINRLGLVAPVPANTARYRFHPVTGACEGLLVEPQRTNLLLRSEEFDNPTWTATSLTVTANSTTAPDGAATADTLAASGAGGKLTQAVTITAGRGIAFGVYAKANASPWVVLSLTDGTNTVDCWFNLVSGATGTHSLGGSGGGFSLTFSQKWIEAQRNGWYLCALEVTSSVATAVSASIAPTAADNTASANGNSLFAWGAHLEADATLTNLTSYIPTTSATVTRSADNLILPVSASQVPLDRGTMIFEFTVRPVPAASGGQSIVLGGVGDTFSNTLYIGRQGVTGVGYTYIQNAVGSNNTKTCAWTPGTIYRYGVAWTSSRIAHCIDGGSITSQALAGPFASMARIAVGCAPWSTSSAGTLSNTVHRAFVYAPICVTDAALQQLTAQ